MDNIKWLGNKQLGLKYEITEKRLNDVKMEILEDIKDILWVNISINMDIIKNTEKFKQHFENHRTNIQKENKEIFSILSKEQKEIQKEIEIRQKKMLTEIGIHHPSTRVQMIAKYMQGEKFAFFDDMIRYIKLKQQKQLHKRTKNKRIQAPKELIDFFEKKIHTPILTILEDNLWPTQN